MRTFVFRVDQLDREPLLKTRSFGSDAEATAYAQQLLMDWPDCAAVEVSHEGELVDRLRPQRP